MISPGSYATGIAARPNGDGYWIVNNKGEIYAFGAAPGTAGVRGLTRHPSENKYQWINFEGGIYQFSNSTHYARTQQTGPC